MNYERYKPGIAIVIFCVILPLAGFILLQHILPTEIFQESSSHIVLETLGFFSGITLAAFILLVSITRNIFSYRIWVASALIAMGILDGFHCLVPGGISAGWLHSMAMLTGSLMFAMVWVDDNAIHLKKPAVIPAAVACIATAMGIFIIIFPGWLPPMLVDTTSSFTPAAIADNIIAGLLFIAGAVALFKRYLNKTNDYEELFFAGFCLLNGMAALILPFSPAWSASFWFWHLLRASAYILLFVLIYVMYRNRELVAEERLRESEERYRTLAESSHDLIYIIDENDRVVYINAYAAGQLGLPKEEIIGKPRSGFFQEEIDERQQDAIMSVFATGKPLKAESAVPLQGGETWQDTLLVPLKDNDGRVTSVMGISRDITKRREAEEALRESRQLLEAILNSITVRVFWKDRNLVYLGCNTPFARDAGFEKPEDIIGKDDYAMGWREQADLYRADDRDVIETGKQKLLFEEPQTSPTGEKIHLLTSKVPLRDADGNIVGVLGTYLDITERRLSEEAIRQANKKLNLLSSITRHDVLNQLTALRGYLELSKMQSPDQKILDFITTEEEITETISRQISFTRDYQDIGIHAPEWQDVKETIIRAVTGLAMESVKLSVDIEDVVIFADPLLEKVFYNLMENALRHAENLTMIRFSSYITEDCLNIVCEDDGCGIPEPEKKRIFERKYFKHTGFGLFLSKEILAITGITIRETGESGKGARFEIIVPKGAYRIKECR